MKAPVTKIAFLAGLSRMQEFPSRIDEKQIERIQTNPRATARNRLRERPSRGSAGDKMRFTVELNQSSGRYLIQAIALQTSPREPRFIISSDFVLFGYFAVYYRNSICVISILRLLLFLCKLKCNRRHKIVIGIICVRNRCASACVNFRAYSRPLMFYITLSVLRAR